MFWTPSLHNFWLEIFNTISQTVSVSVKPSEITALFSVCNIKSYEELYSFCESFGETPDSCQVEIPPLHLPVTLRLEMSSTFLIWEKLGVR